VATIGTRWAIASSTTFGIDSRVLLRQNTSAAGSNRCALGTLPTRCMQSLKTQPGDISINLSSIGRIQPPSNNHQLAV
jgi:hypothetical protein